MTDVIAAPGPVPSTPTPSRPFRLVSPYQPMGDQPRAIEELGAALAAGSRWSTLLGVTGSGKTFAMANLIDRLQRPTLVLSHNKTLAAQLYSEFQGFFPENAVEYFVSYYDYYQPEAYVPSKDLYIEKDSAVNDQIDKLRLSATRSLLSRRDVIIVASVSSIYGLGSPSTYQGLTVELLEGMPLVRDAFIGFLVDIQYIRGDIDFTRGRFRVRGDTVEIWPAYEDSVVRVEFFGDQVERITTVHSLTGELLGRHGALNIYPAKHFVVGAQTVNDAVAAIEAELEEHHRSLIAKGALLEAQRILSRTRYDLEMLREVGYCNGIENYSRHLTGRLPGERPYCLYDFFPPDFLCFVDESHATVPQIRGMFAGDRSRKETLVEHGFRLPSALDNRPLRFDEWEALVHQGLFVSATPGPYEAAHETMRSQLLIRPTGLVDPGISVRPTAGQVEDLIAEVKAGCARNERALITTLTKRLAEDLAEFLNEAGIRTTYLHSDIDALERVEILAGLRSGITQCLVGVNLLREGLDLPEVSLVAILDADKEGFLRSEGSLIQTIGRAARHLNGRVVFYADRRSAAMASAISETDRRREYQLAYNAEHGIVPRGAFKQDTSRAFAEQIEARRVAEAGGGLEAATDGLGDDVAGLTAAMLAAAEALRFEDAAALRDRIKRLEAGETPTAGASAGPRRRRRRKR